MFRITNISILDAFQIQCSFNTGETKVLDLKKSLDINNKYVKKLIKNDTYKNAKIGSFGEIYWEGIAEMKDFDGSIIPCEYDMSPEFVYQNSTKIN
jgi:hypothetical protein